MIHLNSGLVALSSILPTSHWLSGSTPRKKPSRARSWSMLLGTSFTRLETLAPNSGQVTRLPWADILEHQAECVTASGQRSWRSRRLSNLSSMARARSLINPMPFSALGLLFGSYPGVDVTRMFSLPKCSLDIVPVSSDARSP